MGIAGLRPSDGALGSNALVPTGYPWRWPTVPFSHPFVIGWIVFGRMVAYSETNPLPRSLCGIQTAKPVKNSRLRPPGPHFHKPHIRVVM